MFVGEFMRSGFTGPLNWYRNMDRSWELTAAWKHAHVTVPALYVVGEKNLVLAFSGGPGMLAGLKSAAPGLREPVLLPGCGHWTQQERPSEVNQAMIGFLSELA